MSTTHCIPSPAGTQVYRVALGYRLVMAVGGGGMGAFFLSSPFWMFREAKEPIAALILGTVFVGFGLFFVWGAFSVFRQRVEIFHDRIRSTGMFRSREITLANIDGFKIFKHGAETNLWLIARTPPPKRLEISLTMERRSELLNWVAARFPNLDAVAHAVEIEKVRTDSSLGASEAERFARLKRAGAAVRVLTIAGGLAALWGFFFPRPYGWLIAVLAALPVVALAVTWIFRGSIQVDGKDTDARPNIAIVLLAPAVVLALRAFLDWHVLEWNAFRVPFLWIGGGLILALIFSTPARQRQPLTMSLLSAALLVHAYGITVCANGYFDRSDGAIHETTVIDASVNRGKVTTYTLTVQPWIDGSTSRKVEVAREVFTAHAIGTQARINVRRGALGVPWYFVY